MLQRHLAHRTGVGVVLHMEEPHGLKGVVFVVKVEPDAVLPSQMGLQFHHVVHRSSVCRSEQS